MIFLAQRKLDRNELLTNEGKQEFKRWLNTNIHPFNHSDFSLINFEYKGDYVILEIETEY